MAPLVRRSWCPRGQTPVLYQRTCSHKKVSVIAALCISPCKKRLNLYFRLHPDANINALSAKEFLQNLLKQLRSPVGLVWDNFTAHRAKEVQNFILQNPSLHVFFFPPYAPELNPVENVWSYVKMNSMANLPIMDIDSLTSTTRCHVKSIQRKQNLLRSFFKNSHLSLRLK